MLQDLHGLARFLQDSCKILADWHRLARNLLNIFHQINGVTWRTFDVFLEDIVDDGVQVLVAVLEEEGEAVLDAHLQVFEEVWVVHGADF